MNSSERSREARDVDLLDPHRLRESHLASHGPLLRTLLSNQLPANPVGNFNKQPSQELNSALTHSVRGARLAFGLVACMPAPQKENQCQEN